MDPKSIQWQQDPDGKAYCDFRLIRSSDGHLALREMTGGTAGQTQEFKSESDLTGFVSKLATAGSQA